MGEIRCPGSGRLKKEREKKETTGVHERQGVLTDRRERMLEKRGCF